MMYEIVPLLDTPDRREVVEEIVRKVCTFDSAFSDYAETCDDDCIATHAISDCCELCSERIAVVALGLAQGLTWEVWGDEGLSGIIRLSNIRPGEDALGTYIFFDRKLSSKTEVIQEVINWAFTAHPGWQPLNRLTVEIPDFAFALAHHATKKLQFGGNFTYELNGRKIPVEGVKQQAVTWRGMRRDLLQLGLLNT